MNSVIVKTFKNCCEVADGCYNLFGFAVEDYLSKYEKTREEVADEHIFGAVLDSCDDLHNILNVAKLLERAGVKMLIFDTTALDEEFIETLCEWIGGETEFEEMPDVYGDRVVFVR